MDADINSLRKFIDVEMGNLKNIWLTSWKHWREISFVYFVQLIFGFIVGLTFCSAICGSLNGSMVLDQLAKGFDRTVIMDVLNSNPGVLDKTKTVAISLLGIYLFSSVFLHAGWLTNIRNKQYSVMSLLRNGMKFFLPFLGIAIISLLMLILVGGILGVGFSSLVGDPLETFSSEKPFVIWIVFLIFIFLIWSIVVWSWSVSSRYYNIEGNSFLASLKLGFKSIREKFLKFLALGLMLFAIHGLLMFVYYCIMGDRGAPSWAIVVFAILVQQLFAFIRVAVRGFGYSIIDDLSFKNGSQ